MIVMHTLSGEPFDFSPYTARHTGDKTINYVTHDDEKVNLSYFFPEDYDPKGTKYPAFICIHGGDWYGHKIFDDQTEWAGDYFGYLARYYADKGFVGLSVDHVLEDEMKDHRTLMDCYEDCVRAMDYILDRADEYGIDTSRVYLLGESSGGHLAAMLAVAYKREGFSFATAFLGYPVTDFVGDKPAADDKVPKHKSASHFFEGLEPDEYAAASSPVCYIDGDTCPCVLIHGDLDTAVLPQHSTLFHDLMLENGRPCTLHMFKDTTHAFLLAEFTDQYLANTLGVELINEHLKELGENV